MSVDYWWLICLPNSQELSILHPRYGQALESAALSGHKAQIIQTWRNSQGELPRHVPSAQEIPEQGLTCDYFNRAFVLKSFQMLGEEITKSGNKTGFELTPINCFSVYMLSRYSPAAMFWYLLGPQAAEQLPAFMGNFFLRHTEIASSLELIQGLIGTVPQSEWMSRIKKLVPETDAASKIVELPSLLIQGLDAAKVRNCGFLAVSMRAY